MYWMHIEVQAESKKAGLIINESNTKYVISSRNKV
jgi:hypothetical protein